MVLLIVCGPFTVAVAVAAGWWLAAFCLCSPAGSDAPGRPRRWRNPHLPYNLCAVGVLHLVPICAAATSYLLVVGAVQAVRVGVCVAAVPRMSTPGQPGRPRKAADVVTEAIHPVASYRSR